MYYIGVDLGGTNIAVGIADENYNLIVKGKTPTLATRGADAIVEDMANLAASLVKDAGLTFDDIASMGVAAPGAVDSDAGLVKCCNNVAMFQYPIAEKLKSLIPIKKVCLANDADAAAFAEAKIGAGKGCDDLIMITLGTGVGGGIVVNGKLYTGYNNMGGEIGHMTLSFGGRPCSCGRKGCFEAYSSATALIAMTKEKLEECENSGRETAMSALVAERGKVSGRTAFDAMRKGDEAAREVVDTYIAYLAAGITSLINIFQPRVLCIGGGVCGEGDTLLNPLKEIVDREQYGTDAHTDKTELKIAELGNDAGIIGAALIGV